MWELESAQSLVKLNPRSKALKNGRHFKRKKKKAAALLFLSFYSVTFLILLMDFWSRVNKGSLAPLRSSKR